MTIQKLISLVEEDRVNIKFTLKQAGVLVSENAEFALRKLHLQTFPHLTMRHYLDVEEMVSDRDRGMILLMGIPIYSSCFLKDNEVKFIHEKR